MARTKYPVSSEFFPFSCFTPPMNRFFVLLAQKFMKTPKLLWKDPALHVESRIIPGYRGGEVEVFILTPDGLTEPAPCLVNFHGGGFVTGDFDDYTWRRKKFVS